MIAADSLYRTLCRRAVVTCALLGIAGGTAAAQGQAAQGDTTLRFEIYGFGQGDIGFDFGRMNPQWFDVVRPSKLPSTPDEFGKNGNFWASARQSRFGVKGVKLTDYGDVTAVFDFDMFGVGIDAGQTTIRLRHAYGEFNGILGGQLESAFMDLDVFPNILDYWGPNGMLFFRNAQLQVRPYVTKNSELAIALEKPGASADAGDYTGRIELANVKPHFPWPDISGHYKYGGDWGHVQLAGIWRMIRWDQVPTDTFDLSGHVNGWGVSLGGFYNVTDDKNNVLRWQATYGEGIQNYFNDAPVDVGVENQFGNLRTPITGEALPIFGAVLYLDHNWDKKFSSALGWSMVNVTNSDAQASNAFHNGQYASTNLLWTPVSNVMIGGELQYSRRQNFFNDFDFNDWKLQFSFKYSFSQKFGGTK
jgi:hypothetical protein